MNDTGDKKLIVYISGVSQGKVNANSTGNIIINPENGTFYRVKIQVIKKAKEMDKIPLQILEGYKILYN